MNEKIEIIEGNRLIAEFMGDPVYFTKTEGKKSYGMLCNISEVKDWSSVHLVYHESWNALMPVVEKIGELELFTDVRKTFYIIIYPFVCEINQDTQHYMAFGDMNYTDVKEHGGTRIEAVYKATISFIKWYNESTSQEKQS